MIINREHTANIDVNIMYALYYIPMLLSYVTFLTLQNDLTIDTNRRFSFFSKNYLIPTKEKL